jgi:hypothetical protein
MSLSYRPDFKAIAECMEEEIAQATERAAHKYLEIFRQMLGKYNFSRHKITLFCAMGVSNVMVDDKFLHERPNWKENAPYKLLQEIEECMDWDWAYHLDGKSLN